MEKLVKEGSDLTPAIDFDPSSGNFVISGKSVPEDSMGFYAPVIDWLKEYVEQPANKTTFSFKLEYFNTSSSKILLDIFNILENVKDTLCFNWYCEEDDEDLEESASDFGEVLSYDINIVKFKW
ncbi:MAG: DUF1987 domain-containing protein [Cyclobacteriaceae bacterium]|nr:DUF1987 domain-containing protein [Cyclobacteriaceae bacterium]